MDKTVKIGVDSSEAGKFQSEFRREAESLARDMIRSSRQYSTSSKEVLKDIEDQIKAIEKRNKLDAEFKRIRLNSLRERGDVTGTQYQQASRGLTNEYRQDELQTRLLREIVETIVRTSKDEIREDRSNVEKTVRESKTIGRLGVVGDEKEALKETVQAGIISGNRISESTQRAGLNMYRYANMLYGAGGALSSGDVGGMAMMGSRGLMSGMGGVGLAGGLGLTGGAGILALIAAAFSGNKRVFQEARDYAITTQTGGEDLFTARNNFGTDNMFQAMGMSTYSGMNAYARYNRALGGRNMKQLSIDEVLGLTGITRSRDISEDLLSQTIGYQRYSNTGNNVSVVSSLERSLERIFGGEFRNKLVQLPEMMSVYNSLAQQMVQTTGYINSTALTGFVGGIREGFGVEGVNLQRFAGGMLKGFGGSDNNYLRKLQFASLRKANGGGLDYQSALETLENPTSDIAYMQNFANIMKRQGLTQFRSWFKSMGLGAKEAREAFESNDFTKMFEMMGKINQDKTSPQADLNKYFQEAQRYTATAQETQDKLIEFFEKLMSKLGVTLEDDIFKGTAKALKSTPNSNFNYSFTK